MEGMNEFESMIRQQANDGDRKPERQFVEWYSEIRQENPRRPGHVEFPEGGDGGIDLVIETPKKVVLAQLKFSSSTIGKVREFANTIRSWENESDFRAWLDNEVTNASARALYERVYPRKAEAEFVWEFVTLSAYNEKWASLLQKACKTTNRRSRSSLVSGECLVFLSELQKVGAGYADELAIECDGRFLPVVHENNFTTHLCVMRIPSLLKALRARDHVDNLFARNVRLEIPNSEVNRSIHETYKIKPETFFFGNNGVHILATDATFSAHRAVIQQPAIINGGQTVKTLLNLAKETRQAEILVRVTVIPEEFQATDEGRRFVGDIIFMSNNNNKMEPWNLRSNDPVQITISKYLMQHGIFYERKDFEWRQNKSAIKGVSANIHAVDVASIAAVCDDSIGPAGLKSKGSQRLFSTDEKTGGCYRKIFDGIEADLDSMLSKVRLYFIIDKWTRKGMRMPEQFKSYPGAASNFVLGLIWRAIDEAHLPHPLALEIRGSHVPSPSTGRMAQRLVKELFAIHRRELGQGIAQNDIFRVQKYWDQVTQRFLTRPWKKRIVAAVKHDLKRS